MAVYAGDRAVYTPCRNKALVHRTLQWTVNGLVLSISVFCFRRRRTIYHDFIHVGSTIHPWNPHVRYLGVVFDQRSATLRLSPPNAYKSEMPSRLCLFREVHSGMRNKILLRLILLYGIDYGSGLLVRISVCLTRSSIKTLMPPPPP